jgi:AcrR family transcriptional regulator
MLDGMPTARARARAELTQEIKDLARKHLASEGAAGLSLRAVARDLGMVSSAVYRYFPSRDDLLTALIVDAYDAVGAAAEEAEAAVADRTDIGARWMAVTAAVRSWATAHPEEWALIYGSPVPGYRAPEDTIGPATRVPLVLLGLLADGHAAGVIEPAGDDLPVPRALGRELVELARGAGVVVPEPLLARGLLAWSALIGAVGFELFGHLHNVVSERDELFARHMAELARMVGFPVARRRSGRRR